MTTTLGRVSPSPPRASPDPVHQRSSRPPAPRLQPGATPSTATPRFPHLAGLDGVRAIAVVAVLIYHAGAGWLPGGFLGVDVFLVLSGFLITTLVAHEVEHTRAFGIRDFYVRRVARLVPALWTTVAAVGVAGLVWREELADLRGEIVAGLTYTSNWWQIAGESSYFSSSGRPPLLRHLWSLALEGQFYLFAPVMAWVLLRWGRRTLGRVALVLALASTALMTVWAVVAEMPVPFDPSRLYFGTDTRLAPLMIGVALACVWRPWRTWPGRTTWLRGSDATPGWRSGLLADVAGVLALAVVLGVMLVEGELSAGLYRCGFLAFSALAAVVVAAAAHPGSLLARALSLPPLAWLGTRSYGIYLLHWPIFALTRPGLDVPGPEWLVQVLRIALVLGLAELSYRFVETPVRRGAAARWVRGLRASGAGRARLVALGATTAVLTLGLAVALVPTRTSEVERAAAAIEAAGPVEPAAPTTTPTEQAPAPVVPQQSAAPASTDAPAPLPPTEQPTEQLGSVTAVGDSVLAMAAPELGALGVGVDAVKSRQFRDMVDVVLAAREAGTLGTTVIVHGGTNGAIQEADLRRLLDGTADRRLFLVNVHADVAWEGLNNELLARVAGEYPHARVVDWSSAASAHPEWLYGDLIHPREGLGAAAMTDLLWTAVQPG